MKKLDQSVLDEFVIYICKDKYRNLIQNLKLEYCTDELGTYIYLALINIKKSQRKKGYGDAVLAEIVQLADEYNVRIKLWVSNIYGTDMKVLHVFYQKHGFILVKDDKEMRYMPQKNSKYLDLNK